MLKNVRGRGTFVCLAVGGLLLGACGPSYRQDQLVQALTAICATDYHLSVSARQIGQTLAVHLPHDGILQQQGAQIGLAESANEVLGNLLEAIHRVILSSDARLNFYVVLVSDSTVPGAYLTIIRYVEDVRRANANMLPPTEFFHRTIFDLKLVPGQALGLDQLSPDDIQLEQFLSWQLARRIHTQLTDALKDRGIPADVGPCSGEFRNGEFAFTLNVTSAPGQAGLDDTLIQHVFQDATGVIAQVLSDYQFKRFDHVRLTHLPTGRSLLLPKTRLELFR